MKKLIAGLAALVAVAVGTATFTNVHRIDVNEQDVAALRKG